MANLLGIGVQMAGNASEPLDYGNSVGRISHSLDRQGGPGG